MVALPALGRASPSLEFPDASVSGSGEVAPELLRPPPLGRPIRLFDSIDAAAGNLDGGRIVTFEWSEGSCGRVFRAPVLRSSREEYDNGRSRARELVSEGGEGVVAVLVVLVPRDARFDCEYTPVPGPVERFRPVIPAVVEYAYSPADGTGRNVGVAGREVGVGTELVVAVVLRLAPERRDCGRRIPVFVLLNKEPPLSLWTAGDAADVEAPRRNAVGAEGLETRLRSLSVSFAGDGESSMMSTQPDVSATGVLAAFVSMSALLLPTISFASAGLPLKEFDLIVLAVGVYVEVAGE